MWKKIRNHAVVALFAALAGGGMAIAQTGTTFSALITDAHQLAGVTAARNDYNAKNASVPNFTPFASDTAYMTWVIQQAAQSYAIHYGT